MKRDMIKDQMLAEYENSYMGYHHIQISKKDEEKTTFHHDEGVFATQNTFQAKERGSHLPKTSRDHIRRVNSKTEQDLIQKVEETLLTLKNVNMKLNPKKCSFKIEEGKFLGYIVTSKGIRANPKKTKDVMDMPSLSNLKQMHSLSGKLATLNRLVAESPMLTAPMKDKELMVYLSATDEAVSAIILVERNKKQMPSHYVSRSLQGAKLNYALMEKLALALVHVVERLRRLAKWAVELGAHDISYDLRNVINGQGLADPLADTVTAGNPAHEEVPGSVEVLESS
nr:hypothetical protein [Tanacetum cinerariifolium]